MNTIRLSGDGSQLVGEMRAVKASVDDTISAFGKLNAAQQASDYRQAAQITRQIDNARSVKPDTSNMQSSGVSGNTATLTQALSEAQQAGNYRQAAQITHQIDNARRLKPDNPELQRTHVPSYSGANAHKLDTRLEILTKTIDELTHQLEEATEKGQSREAYNISAALNNVEQERQRLEQEKKLSEQKKDKDDPADVIKRYGLSRYFTQGLGYVQQIAGIGFNRRTAMANGDYLGADVGVLEGRSNIAQNLGGSVFGAGMTLGATPAGVPLMLTGGVLSILGTIGNILAGDKRADIAEGSAYERSLTHTGALNRRYAQGGAWEDNASRTSELLEKAAKYAEGTNMSAYDIVDIATQMSQYGAGTGELALKQASEVAARANATGVDAATVQNLLGTAYRYGDRSDVLGYASQARQAAGMTKAQDKEFLMALQGVIEEGIAGGYVKSVEDVSKTMTMFARLSNNNPLWQGAQGASRLRQMDSAISGATGLQSTSDMIVVTAAQAILDNPNLSEEEKNKFFETYDKNGKRTGSRRTGTYIDTMLLTEQGNNPAMFEQIAKSVQDLEGKGNIAGQVERFKDIFKLNYHGAVDVYNMFQELQAGKMTEADFQKQIESMQKDEAYQSDDTKRQNAITNIETSVALMAKSKFWDSTNYLSNMSVDKNGLGNPLNYGSAVEVIEGNEAAAAEQALNDKDLKRLVQKGDLRPGQGGTTYENLINKQGVRFDGRKTVKTGGNDERDNLLWKGFVDWAIKDDGKIDTQELLRMLKAHDTPGMQKAYNSGDIDTYTAALEKMFKNLLANATFYISNN